MYPMHDSARHASIDLLESFARAEKLVLVLEREQSQIRIVSAGEDIDLPLSPGIVGRLASDVMPAGLSELIRNTVRQVLASQREQRVEYSLPVGGIPLDFVARIFPLSPDSVLWLVRNTAAVKFAALPVLHQLELSQAILANLGEGVCAVDLHGRLLFLNAAAQSLLGWTESELSDRDLHDILHGPAKSGARYSPLQCPLCDAIRQEYAVSINEAFLLHKDRSAIPVSITVSPIRIGGHCQGAVITFRDNRVRLALEEELRQAHKWKAVGQLAGDVAHDFNNLLTVINGYASLLIQRADFPGSLRENLNEIARAGERASLLTQRLLAFGHRRVLNVRVVDLNSLLTGLQPVLRRLLRHDISLGIRLCANAPHVMADPDQLEQVVVYLALNARDAMPAGGQITFETSIEEVDPGNTQAHPGSVAGPHVRLTVKDNGIGMPPELQARIFEPFCTTKDPEKGTGLGLSVVSGVVKQSGGHLQVQSAPNQGTTMAILLPRVTMPVPSAPSGVPSAPDTHCTESILLVEYDDSVRHFAREVLLRHGYRVLTAVSGSDAMNIASRFEGKIDLLLSDVVVPGTNGPDVAKRFLEHRTDSAVLFMAGAAGDSLFCEQSIAPGTVLLHKPFSAQALLSHVRRQLSRSPATILVADDQSAIRTLVRNALAPFGYSVLEAEDGCQLHSICRSTPIDLILTDLTMPEEDGLEAIPALRKEFPAIPIIAMSGSLLSEDLLRMAQLLGAKASIAKPLDCAALPDLVQGVLRKGPDRLVEREREPAHA